MSSVGAEMPKEMARVRDLIPIYEAIPMGFIAAGLMKAALDEAAVALATGDIIAILRSYQSLKGFKA